MGAVRRSRPARVLQAMVFGVAFVFLVVHLAGGLESASTLAGSFVTADRRVPGTPATARSRDDSPFPRSASQAFAASPKKVIRDVVAVPRNTVATPRKNPIPPPPPPPVTVRNETPQSSLPTLPAVSSREAAKPRDARKASYDDLDSVREVATRFSEQCRTVAEFFAAAGERYAPGSLKRPDSLGVLVIDWSENHFNGIGDEMQHYQEMLAIGLGTGRTAYLQTQNDECAGAGTPRLRLERFSEECRFDLEDYFTGIGGVDWRWDAGKQKKLVDELGEELSDPRNELVVTWSDRGMYYGVGRDSVAAKETESPEKYVAPPDANSIEIMLNDPVYKNAKVVRLRIKQNFGHWCHPNQKGDWGMCASYRWVAGIEGITPDSRDKNMNPSCPSCSVGGCFGAAVIHPREFLKDKVAPYLAEMETWGFTVAAHVRTGFADVSQVVPPKTRRRENATLQTIDAFLASEARRVPYPEPTCPAAQFAKDGVDKTARVPGSPRETEASENANETFVSIEFDASLPSNKTKGPLSDFLRCVAATGTELGADSKRPWGVFLMTDSPGVRVVVEGVAHSFGIPAFLATDGAYGHVKASNTAVCVDESGDSKNAKSDDTDEEPSCDPSDPRPAWERSMMDMVLMGFSDIEVMLFQSKFGAAAGARSRIKHGLREFYGDTRFTHSLVAPLVAEMSHGKFEQAPEDRKDAWIRVWDLLGPPGDRESLKTSQYAD